jgi:hypothetical protein
MRKGHHFFTGLGGRLSRPPLFSCSLQIECVFHLFSVNKVVLYSDVAPYIFQGKPMGPIYTLQFLGEVVGPGSAANTGKGSGHYNILALETMKMSFLTSSNHSLFDIIHRFSRGQVGTRFRLVRRTVTFAPLSAEIRSDPGITSEQSVDHGRRGSVSASPL